MTKKRIVVVTAGGHIATFHVAMLQMLDTLRQRADGQFELLGAWGGMNGLAQGQLVPIRRRHLEPLRAGSLIGTDRSQADVAAIDTTVRRQNIHAVLIMGGDNHMGELARLDKLRVVGFPKTMDGDLNSHITLGWHTAVTVGARQTRAHHHTAMTARRVFFVGLFGRNTDWTLSAVTAYGGGDLGIPCEEEYAADMLADRIREVVRHNQQRFGIPFAVVPYSEGARIRGLSPPPPEHYSEDKFGQPKLQPEWLGMELVRLARRHKLSAAFQAHTYDMRDAQPTAVDQRLSRLAADECVRAIVDGDFGTAAAFAPDGAGFFRTLRQPIREVAVQRQVRLTDFFDYSRLRPQQAFIDEYGTLFRDPLGTPPTKDELVYRNLLPAAQT